MAVMNSWRRPLRVGEIVAGAWTIFRRNPNDLLIMGAIAALPNFVSVMIMTPIAERLPAYTGQPEFNLSTGEVLTLVLGGLPLLILEWLMLAAVYHAAFDLGESGKFSLGASYLRMARRFGVLLLAGLIGFVVPMALGTTVLLLPLGLFLLVHWALAPAVILIEDMGSIAGLKRSWHLVKRNWWHTFAALLMLFLTYRILPALIVLGMFGFLFQNLLSQSLITLVVNAASLPLFAAGVVALYFDLRARKGEFIGTSQVRTAEPVSPGEGA